MYGAVALRLRSDGVRKAYVLFTPESDSGSFGLSGTAEHVNGEVREHRPAVAVDAPD